MKKIQLTDTVLIMKPWKGNKTMPDMTFADFLRRRDEWGNDGNRLMSQEEVAEFDRFFSDEANLNQYQNEGFTRARVGDFSQFETAEPIIKAYLGARKCYDLYDRYGNNPSDPGLQQEIRKRLMEVDLRAGFALGGNDPRNPIGAFLKECERIANQQMLIQTLEDPNPTARLNLQNQLKRENPATAERKMEEALSRDLEQRVEMAKILFLNHLGKFKTYNSENQLVELNENMAEIYTHGGRTMFILPEGADQKRVFDEIRGKHPEQSGLEKRYFATHAIKPRTLNANGSISSEAEEFRVKGANTFSFSKHRGMNVSAGGLGHVGPHGKMISSDGTNGHMYMHWVSGKKNTCGTMLVGFENAGPGEKGRLGHAHDIRAKKGGSSAFLSDKSYRGKEFGGRVVDLSGLSDKEFADLLEKFEDGYRNAAKQAQAGNTNLLDACNELLTGKLMSVGQMKGMLQGLNVLDVQSDSVENARAGYYRAEGYFSIFPENHPAIPMKVAENPVKRPFRVTECEGLTRPEPPAVMKKPSRLDKVLHYLSFKSKYSYVSRYKKYQRDIPEMMKDYKERMTDYLNTLDQLENGEDPRGLRNAYEQAIKDAEKTYGLSSEKSAAPKMQNSEIGSVVRPISKEVADQLENTLLDKLFEDIIPKNAFNGNMEEMREEFRGHIKDTLVYKKLILSGDKNVSDVLKDPEQMKNVLSEVAKGIAEKADPVNKSITNNVPHRNIEVEIKPIESGPKFQ